MGGVIRKGGHWNPRRPPCPGCGGVNQRVMSGGWVNARSLPYSYIRCLDCDYHGMQVLVWLPPEASVTSMDAERRDRMRMNARIRKGQLPQLGKLGNRQGMRLTDDKVRISVRVVPGRVEAGLAKRLPAMKRKVGPEALEYAPPYWKLTKRQQRAQALRESA